MVNTEIFGALVPLQSLRQADRAQLAKLSSILTFTPDQMVFEHGELARTQVFLLSGELVLQGQARQETLVAGTDAARFPIAPGTRRSLTAICRKSAQVLFVDAEMLDLLLTWGGTGGSGSVDAQDEVTAAETVPSAEPSDADDWMTALLQSRAFLRVPPANIAELFAAMEAVSFHPGEVIIEINTPGDYYYIVTHGRVQVVLPASFDAPEEELAQLGVGKAFGEEALVSGAPRNATVRALTRCVLMRLSNDAFTRLLRAPFMPELTYDQPPQQGQQLIDVRLPAEFDHQHLPDAINVPLKQIRGRAKSLNPGKEYWVYCDTGRRSASATFLLNQCGINAKLLKSALSKS
jgi:rhodanese-related sulfurtransferase